VKGDAAVESQRAQRETNRGARQSNLRKIIKTENLIGREKDSSTCKRLLKYLPGIRERT